MRCFDQRSREDARVDHSVVVDKNRGLIVNSEDHCALDITARDLER